MYTYNTSLQGKLLGCCMCNWSLCASAFVSNLLGAETAFLEDVLKFDHSAAFPPSTSEIGMLEVLGKNTTMKTRGLVFTIHSVIDTVPQ